MKLSKQKTQTQQILRNLKIIKDQAEYCANYFLNKSLESLNLDYSFRHCVYNSFDAMYNEVMRRVDDSNPNRPKIIEFCHHYKSFLNRIDRICRHVAREFSDVISNDVLYKIFPRFIVTNSEWDFSTIPENVIKRIDHFKQKHEQIFLEMIKESSIRGFLYE